MRSYGQQKAALTRATRSGNPERVESECRKAKAEWGENGWPDDWSRWQRALDDTFPWPTAPQLDSL